MVQLTLIAALAHAAIGFGDSRQEIGAMAAKAESAKTTVVAGKGGWYFFGPELRHLSVGPFWGTSAAKVSRAPAASADPLAAILDFKAQCDKAGVELLLVPVPGKAAVYPGNLLGHAPTGPLDASDVQFFGVLRRSGVKVLDLAPQFRRGGSNPTFCKQDTHWSGTGVSIAADAIGAELKKKPWYAGVPKSNYSTKWGSVSSVGDLGGMASPKAGAESIRVSKVTGKTEPWRDSPVVLLGDSHNLIFSAGGDMISTGAGLPENLAAKLRFPVDLVAVRGSGATPARVNLARRRDNLKGKKIVVWCFTTREFTEGQGWRKVPVVR